MSGDTFYNMAPISSAGLNITLQKANSGPKGP